MWDGVRSTCVCDKMVNDPTTRPSMNFRELLMSDETPSAVARLDDLRDRQRSAWQRGERLLVETLVADITLTLADSELLELIYAEVMLRAERGESCLVEEYPQRFPQFAESLGRLFAVHVGLEAWGGQLRWGRLNQG